MQNSPLATALTIAGSDSGGGAGIQADLKTFAALGVHGTSAITCLTAQNPNQVVGVQPTRPGLLCRQIEAVFAELKPVACKTGMLHSASLVRTVARFFRAGKDLPLIVDPVMVASSGARLLATRGLTALQDDLLPLATLATPNLHEAEILTELRLREPEDLRAAARIIVNRFGCAALIKGGHLAGTTQAIDVFYDGKTELLLSAPFVRALTTHGTGCTYSAAITAFCARGSALSDAVCLAKDYITQAIAQGRRAGRHHTLGWFWNQPPARRLRALPKIIQ